MKLLSSFQMRSDGNSHQGGMHAMTDVVDRSEV